MAALFARCILRSPPANRMAPVKNDPPPTRKLQSWFPSGHAATLLETGDTLLLPLPFRPLLYLAVVQLEVWTPLPRSNMNRHSNNGAALFAEDTVTTATLLVPLPNWTLTARY